MLSDLEVLVVGLGPAGACAAAAAARAGTTVLAIERRRRIGWPVQCAELVPRALAGEAVRRATLQPVSGLETVVEDQPAEVRNDPGRVIDRARFDVLLAEAAVAAGGGPAVSGPVRVIDTGLRPARWNIAFDQALIELHRGARIPDTIRFLRFPRSALVGRHQALAREVHQGWCRANGVEIARRIPGGGAIWFEPAQLGWELVVMRRALGPSLEAAAQICRAAAAGLPARPRCGVPAAQRHRGRRPQDLRHRWFLRWPYPVLSGDGAVRSGLRSDGRCVRPAGREARATRA